ncbi:MAG: DUF6273 domain-containing protein [Acutalibacter sp.]
MVNNTQYLTGGKSPNPLSPPTNLAAKSGNGQVTLTWTDPPNATSEPSGQTIATWAYTLIVRKEGSQPTGPSDGALVVKSSVRDQYKTSGFVDTGLTNDTLYYYGAFAYNSDKVVSQGAFVSATPQAGTPLSQLAEGTLIKILENGSPVEFYLSKHNYEPDLNGQGRELVVRKDCFDQRQWNSSNVNTWANSTMRSWLNSGYKSLLSSGVQSLISTTQYYYTPGNKNWNISSRSDPVFLISATELGMSANWIKIEGTQLSISSVLQLVYLNGQTVPQWTRSPSTFKTEYAMQKNNYAGVDYGNSCTTSYGSRPCFTLPATALVDQDLNL